MLVQHQMLLLRLKAECSLTAMAIHTSTRLESQAQVWPPVPSRVTLEELSALDSYSRFLLLAKMFAIYGHITVAVEVSDNYDENG